MGRFVNNSGYLAGQLLVATSVLKGSLFERAVVYLCAHSEIGAMGLLVNNVMREVSYFDILDQLQIPSSEINCNHTLYMGGPLEASRGFILHSDDYNSDLTQKAGDNIALTSTVKIIEDIVSGDGPEKSLIALGYVGWAKGQLESEIMSNSWLTVPADESIVFGSDNGTKWYESGMLLGVDIETLPPMGSA